MSSLSSLLASYKALNRDKGQEPDSSSSRPEYFHPFYNTMNELYKSNSNYTSTTSSAVAGADAAITHTYNSGLGILLIIIDDLPLEAFWRLWIDAYNEGAASAGRGEVRVWVHAKHPDSVRSEWVRSRFVKSFQLRPEWGSVEITTCMFRMLVEAMGDSPSIGKFAFASESCLPIMPLDEVFRVIDTENKICGDNSSWMQYIDSPNNGYARQQQWDALHNRIPEQCIRKADQWVLLSRAHAQAVIDLDRQCVAETEKPLIDLFKKVRASDEIFFPCCLGVVGAIGRGEVCKKRLAHCDWSVSAKNPKTYTTLEPLAVAEALSARSIFIRKVKMDFRELEEERVALLAWLGEQHAGAAEGVAGRVDAVLTAVSMERRKRPPHRDEHTHSKRGRH